MVCYVRFVEERECTPRAIADSRTERADRQTQTHPRRLFGYSKGLSNTTVPELPEVETVRRGLLSLRGGTITDCVFANPKVLREQSPETFRARVVSTVVRAIDRRGKYLMIRLGVTERSPEPFSIYVHLKMRGQIRIEAADSEPDKYHCITVVVRSEEGTARAVRFYDIWTWGEMRVLTDTEARDTMPLLGKMGVEPLTDDWTGAELMARLRGRRTAIKPTLLDQTIVAGIGNIYADEALHRAGIHSQRVAGTITQGEANAIVSAAKTVLTEAIGTGGTTSDNFFDTGGAVGRYEPRVYGRAKMPCRNCDTPLVGIRLAGRSAVFCPVCQPEPDTTAEKGDKSGSTI